jgi:hypothetical protein
MVASRGLNRCNASRQGQRRAALLVNNSRKFHSLAPRRLPTAHFPRPAVRPLVNKSRKFHSLACGRLGVLTCARGGAKERNREIRAQGGNGTSRGVPRAHRKNTCTPFAYPTRKAGLISRGQGRRASGVSPTLGWGRKEASGVRGQGAGEGEAPAEPVWPTTECGIPTTDETDHTDQRQTLRAADAGDTSPTRQF